MQLVKDHTDYVRKVEQATDYTIMYDYMKESVNKTICQFIMSQITQQKLKPRGRRFTDQEKCLVLSLS